MAMKKTKVPDEELNNSLQGDQPGENPKVIEPAEADASGENSSEPAAKTPRRTRRTKKTEEKETQSDTEAKPRATRAKSKIASEALPTEEHVVSIGDRHSAQTEADKAKDDLLDLLESLKAGRVLTDVIQGVEKTGGDYVAVLYHGDFKVIIPALEAIIPPNDYRDLDPNAVHKYMLTKRLGAKLDYIVKGIDPQTGMAVASRLEESGKIEVYKKDPNGKDLSGAYFLATNTETGEEFGIGPTNSSGYAATKEDIPFGTYKIVETVFPTDYTYSGTKEWTRTVSSANDGVVTINAVNELKKGNIEVYKKENVDGAALSGAIFTVYNSAGTKVTTIGPTNDRGYAKSADIPYGTYKVVETTFPFNYEASGQTEWTVTINTAKGALATINATNQLKKGYVEILKSDAESGKDLSGAEFTVYDYDGEEIAVIGPTNSDGYAKSGEIIYGDYIVKETKVPMNYQPEGDAEWHITIDDNSPLITLDIANLRQYGSVKVVKTAEDGLVEGMVFTLTGTSVYGEKVSMTATTNAAGVAVFERVPIGEDYVLAEKNTPVRYVIPENQTLNVYWNKVTEREFDNVLKKWRADVFKVDSGIRYGGMEPEVMTLSLDSDAIVEQLGSPYGESQGDATLAGAVCGVYRYDELVETSTTAKNGYFLLE